MPTSWKAEVKVYGETKYVANGLRFPTEKDAMDYAIALHGRWTQVEKYRTAESDDPVNYVNGEYRSPPVANQP